MTLIEAMRKCWEMVGPDNSISIDVEASCYRSESGKINVGFKVHLNGHDFSGVNDLPIYECTTLEECVRYIAMKTGNLEPQDVTIGDEVPF